MMTEPKQPDDHPPAEGASKMPPHAPNGVPPGVNDADATGSPTSDRQATETAASPDKHKP
jgi:hypothetical protein